MVTEYGSRCHPNVQKTEHPTSWKNTLMCENLARWNNYKEFLPELAYSSDNKNGRGYFEPVHIRELQNMDFWLQRRRATFIIVVASHLPRTGCTKEETSHHRTLFASLTHLGSLYHSVCVEFVKQRPPLHVPLNTFKFISQPRRPLVAYCLSADYNRCFRIIEHTMPATAYGHISCQSS